ncbi:MAG: hypothetical protein AAF717_12830 [Bacteroidota bacterium]
MKKIFLVIVAIILSACSNDGDAWKLTDSIGSIPVVLNDSTTFSYFVPGTGTFVFKQTFERGTTANDIQTELRIRDNDTVLKMTKMEIMVFDSDNFSNTTLDFLENFTITINDPKNTTISSNGKVFLDSTNFYISQFSDSALSGSFQGIAKISEEQSVDANGNEQPDKIEELFNVFGNINEENQLFLLSIESNAKFSSLSGTFSIEDQLFFGKAFKDNDTLNIKAQETNALVISTDTTQVDYNLLITEDNITKKLVLNLTKNLN